MQEDPGPSASGRRARELWGGRMLGVPTTSTPCPHTTPERQMVCSSDGARCWGQELAVRQRRGLSPQLPQGQAEAPQEGAEGGSSQHSSKGRRRNFVGIEGASLSPLNRRGH